MNLYEMNQQIISQMPELKDLRTPMKEISDWEKANKNVYFYMMYSHDISYFTLFNRVLEGSKDYISLADGVINCLHNVGEIKAIDKTDSEEANGFEIWVRPYEKDKAIVMYLYPYDEGVVQVG